MAEVILATEAQRLRNVAIWNEQKAREARKHKNFRDAKRYSEQAKKLRQQAKDVENVSDDK